MAIDLSIDELVQLHAAATPGEWVVRYPDHDPVPSWRVLDEDNLLATAAFHNAANALFAASRAAKHRGETLERVAEAVGYPRDAHYGDVLGRIDDIVAERDRLRAEQADHLACLEAARREVEALRALHVTSVREAELLTEVGRLRALCREAAGYMSARTMHPLSEDLYERLRAAGGGT